jgi:mannosyltransferase OCH1-like enzyme
VIPRIIHQIWLGYTSAEPPPDFDRAATSWQETNPDWEYRLWSGTDVEALIASARPDLLPYYRGLPYWVQKADAARYLILFELGGVYADLDIVCLKAFDAFVDAEAVLAPTKPLGLSNDLMMASARHPLFGALVNELSPAFRRWHRPWIPRHFRVMCGTGSLLLTRTFARSSEKDGIRLLSAEEYGHGDPAKAFVRHIDGNTWAGWDTRLLVFISTHWKLIAGGVVAVVVLLLLRGWLRGS